MTDWLKFIGTPGSPLFTALAVGAALFIGFVWPRRPRFALAAMSGLATLYLAMALPVVASWTSDALWPYRPCAPVPRGNVLILISGDNPAGRLMATLAAFRQWSFSPVVVVGGAWWADQLVEAGIPRARILNYTGARTTREQMDWVAKYMSVHRESAVLVASRVQMPRIASLAAAAGLQLALDPSPADVEPARSGTSRWVPTLGAMKLTRDAVYEHAALAYYASRGWIARAASPPSRSDSDREDEECGPAPRAGR